MKTQTSFSTIFASIVITLTCIMVSHDKATVWWDTDSISHSAQTGVTEPSIIEPTTLAISHWWAHASPLTIPHWTMQGAAKAGVRALSRAATDWQLWSVLSKSGGQIGRISSQVVSGVWHNWSFFCGGQIGERG
jgi:hypothetical protein